MTAHTAWLRIVAVHVRLVGAIVVCLALRTTATAVVVVLRAYTTNAFRICMGRS